LVTIEVPESTDGILLQWAPAHLPREPRYPYELDYHLIVDARHPHNFARRLQNLGFFSTDLEERVKAFQRVYELAPTGIPEHIEHRLHHYHDQMGLPPVPVSGGGPGSQVFEASPAASGAGGSVTTAVTATAGGSPLRQPLSSSTPRPAAPLADVIVRLEVVDPQGRAIPKVAVEVRASDNTATTKTTTAGRADITIKTADTQVEVMLSKRHHAPYTGTGGSVVTGPVIVNLELEQGTLAERQPDSGPPVFPEVSGKSRRVRRARIVMIDGIFARAQAHPDTPTRQLSKREVMTEYLRHLHHGEIALLPRERLDVLHDPKSGDGDPCTDKCKLKAKRFKVANIFSKVKFLYLSGGSPGRPRKGDVFEGQHHFRDSFTCKDVLIGSLDTRNAVGMVRLARWMREKHDVFVVYHIGFMRGRPGAHNQGRAIDVGGFARSIPGRETISPPRMKDDFHVALHWGRVAMFDPKTVAAHPNDSSKWTRLPATQVDDLTNYPDYTPQQRLLRYRLDPLPYPTPPPALPSGPADSRWLVLRDHFDEARTIFRSAFDFFVAEYSDSHDQLGPSAPANVPTPIDSPHGHFVLHPDYGEVNSGGKSNGRQAHFNHFHAQLGPTGPI